MLTCGPAAVQLPKDKSSDAQWLEAPERGGAEGVEELALEAVQQLKLAGWDVARDLQAPPPPSPPCAALQCPGGWHCVGARMQAGRRQGPGPSGGAPGPPTHPFHSSRPAFFC